MADEGVDGVVEADIRPPGQAPVHIGCSGWQYKHWRGNFYPTELSTTQWLEHYAARFDTVEVNNSFYRLPRAETFAEWRLRTPPTFVYAVKSSRYLTHMKKLKEPVPPIELFFARARNLGAQLGPVLYQLPSRWPRHLDRLEAFLHALPKDAMHAVEFRDSSWYCDETLALLTAHQVALCLHDMPESATGTRAIGPFLYLRLHGPTRYAGRYADGVLDSWAEWCAECHSRGMPVYVYFNNDIGGHAPKDAARLRERVCRLC